MKQAIILLSREQLVESRPDLVLKATYFPAKNGKQVL